MSIQKLTQLTSLNSTSCLEDDDAAAAAECRAHEHHERHRSSCLRWAVMILTKAVSSRCAVQKVQI